jgi:hypothetical protein
MRSRVTGEKRMSAHEAESAVQHGRWRGFDSFAGHKRVSRQRRTLALAAEAIELVDPKGNT